MQFAHTHAHTVGTHMCTDVTIHRNKLTHMHMLSVQNIHTAKIKTHSMQLGSDTHT